MNLSSELISQFVKITKDDKPTDNGSTVYGTIVEYEGTRCVKLDGSDQITPITSTADVLPGDRVAVLIKNHTATVTGNVTSPSARKETVDGLGEEVKEHSDKISEFELVVADMVTTEQLNATQANIELLIADKANVSDLEAERAEIDELLAKKATIEQLEAVDGKFDSLDAKFLTADAADIKYATIENLNATNGKFNTLESTFGEFEEVTTAELDAHEASIDKLNADVANIDEVYAKTADIEILYATKAEVDLLEADVAEIDKLVAKKADIESLNATNAEITNLKADVADIDVLVAKKADVESLNATNADVTNLKADVADIDTLIFGSASGTTIQTSFANAVIAQLGNAQIKSAMIDSLDASKINAGTINTNNVNIQSDDGRLVISDETIQISDDTRVRVQIGKDASNDYSINIWDADGNLMFSEGGITDNAIKEAIIRNDMVSDDANIAASKLDISSLFSEINNSTQTINSSKILMDADNQTLDVAFTKMSSDISGLSDDVSSQGTALSVVQGKIDSKVWQQDITSATDELGDEIDTLTTKQSTFEQTLNGLSTTVSSHTTQIASKADNSAVTSVSDKVSKLESNLDGFKSTVSETYATKSALASTDAKADGIQEDLNTLDGEVDTLTTKQSTFEQTLDGISATVSSHTTQIASKADNSTVTTVSNRVGELEADLDGFRSSVSETYATKTALAATDAKTEDIQGDVDTLGGEVDTLTTKQSTFEQTLNGISATVSEHESEISKKADSTTVTTVTNRVSELESSLDGFKSTVSETYATKSALESTDAKAAEAQTTATNAKNAADNAQADIDSITTRVTTAETKITQNTEAIELRATKSEVTQTLGGYYTKAEADAAITVKTNEITQNVSKTYATITSLNTTNTNVTAAATAAANAQSAADDAQETADDAATAASNAQSTANTAKTNAATAQSTAEAAQTAASNAQSTANEANDAVDALGVRVTSAETAITQNAEAIELRATKTELSSVSSTASNAQSAAEAAQTAASNAQNAADSVADDLADNYYTKTETEAKIKVSADSITSSVSSTYATKTALSTTDTKAANAQADIDGLEIGGRNLFAGYGEEEIQLNDYQNTGSFTQFIDCLTFNPCETVGQVYTISLWAKSPNGTTSLAIYNQNSQPRHFYFPRTTLTNALGDEWERFSVTVENVDMGETYVDTYCNRIEIYAASQMGVLVKKIKVECGNRVTDWTPAPEDVDEATEKAQDAANDVAGRMTLAESQIQQLANSISSLVRKDGQSSMLRQEEDGLWYFDISSIEDSISETANDLSDLDGIVRDANGKIDVLASTANALQDRTEYVRSYRDENDQPCLELGEGDSTFKVRITNTEIQFVEDTAVPAKLNRKMLVIEKAMIKDELQFGDDEAVDGVWIWKRRANGNLGLIWKGVEG